jgi:hypothetical protein
VLDHLLPLACVFNGFLFHVCFSTNSAGSGQDYPGAALTIFRLMARCKAVLPGPEYFRLSEKDLDPLLKYYNNQTHKQKADNLKKLGWVFPGGRFRFYKSHDFR